MIDRDEYLERCVLGLALIGGPAALAALRSGDWRRAELGFSIEAISGAKRRAIYTAIASRLSDPTRIRGPLDPCIIRSDLLDAADQEAAAEVLECAVAARHARPENIRHYLARLDELRVRREQARAERRTEAAQ